MAKKKNALDIEYVLSEELSDLLGTGSATRAQVTKAVWDYIKQYKLQDPKDKRTIVPDATLASVVGRSKFNMLKLAGKLNKHFIDRV